MVCVHSAEIHQERRRREPESTRLTPQLGFVVDVVGYGRRSSGAQHYVQVRLTAVLANALEGIGFEFQDTDHDVGSGDGLSVFLPVGIDPTVVLPGLLRAMTRELAYDNARYRDRIRARMAVGFGLVGWGPLGFTGPLIMDLSRLNDSMPIRTAVDRCPHADLAVLVSNPLHELIRAAYQPADLASFRRVDVLVKEFFAAAWLWTSPPSELLPGVDVDLGSGAGRAPAVEDLGGAVEFHRGQDERLGSHDAVRVPLDGRHQAGLGAQDSDGGDVLEYQRARVDRAW